MTEQTSDNAIAIDAMGGDHGVSVTVPAALAFLRAQEKRDGDKYKIILVGLSDQINAAVSEQRGDYFVQKGVLSIMHASEVVAMNESPALALKKKKDSSMRVAINLVKDGKATACVSAGNTGALMGTAKFVLKTTRGIDRPAIISTMPCLDPQKTVHVLDLGANVDSTPEMLLQFALMGSVVTRFIDKKENPSIGLLNVGAEEIKGSEKVKKAAGLLSASSLNYVGFVEGDELLSGKVDVIVCDGFEGNVALKASEGTAKMIFAVLKEEYQRGLLSKLAALMALPVLRRIQARLDPRRHNGASLVGLNGIVVKSHGGADEFGFLHAIDEACLQSRRKVIQHITREISDIQENQ